jgi:DNA repair protein RecN (Recombination protein N)
MDTDSEALSRIEERLAELATIKRKYGPTIMDAIARRDELSSEVEVLENAQIRIESLTQDIETNFAELNKTARKLSASRKALCEKVGSRIETGIKTLGLANCCFQVSIDESELSSDGFDRIEFLIKPNPGQELMPVAKIASGGELSRVMLAIKSICAEADGVETVIFDEIDAGLSGVALKAVRDRLAKLSRTHQILCITHQPVIASVADNHVNVSKSQSRKSTVVEVSLLDGHERVQSLAFMAGGGKDNADEALRFARTLIDEADGLRARAKKQ